MREEDSRETPWFLKVLEYGKDEVRFGHAKFNVLVNHPRGFVLKHKMKNNKWHRGSRKKKLRGTGIISSLQKVVFDLGLEGLVRPVCRNVMEEKCPSEGMDTLTILFGNS